MGGPEGPETVRDEQPRHRRDPRDVPPRDEGRRRRRGESREGRVRQVEEDASPEARGTPPRGRSYLPKAKGGSRSSRHRGDGEGHRRGTRRRPGGDRFLRVRGGGGPPDGWRDRPLGTPEQDVPHDSDAGRTVRAPYAPVVPDRGSVLVAGGGPSSGWPGWLQAHR